MRKTINVCLILVAYVLSTAAAHAGHPSEGYEPNSIEHIYSGNCGMPIDWSFGNVQLTDTRVPVEELTAVEKYMLAGTRTSDYGEDVGLQAWKVTLLSIVNKFNKTHGYIPAQMTPELIITIPGYEQITSEMLELYRSPITGDWPRLDCREFSAGNAYMVKLTPAELNHFAQKVPMYEEMWGDNCWWEPTTREYKCIDIVSPIYFMRVYGENDVLYEAIDFIWHTYR